jgi:hypothetical protein
MVLSVTNRQEPVRSSAVAAAADWGVTVVRSARGPETQPARKVIPSAIIDSLFMTVAFIVRVDYYDDVKLPREFAMNFQVAANCFFPSDFSRDHQIRSAL